VQRLAAEREEDRADNRPATVQDTDRDGEEGEPVDEVDRPVDRVDDPLELVVALRVLSLLAEHGVFGEPRAHRLGQVGFHRLVGRGDRVGLRLVLVLDLQRPAVARQDDLAGLRDEFARRHLDRRQRRVVREVVARGTIVPAIGVGGRSSYGEPPIYCRRGMPEG